VFLNIIRVRRPTEEEIERTLGPLFVEDEEARAWVISNTTVITSHHAQRGRHGRVLHVQALEERHLDSSGISPCWNYRATFPLMPAYAIMGHAKQGATLRGRVLIHMLSCFAQGLLYVMPSRVARRFDDDGNPLLRIVGCVIDCSSWLRDACFSPPACADGSTATTLCLSFSPLKTPSRRFPMALLSHGWAYGVG